MKAFEFLRAETLEAASHAMGDAERALLKAGGVDTLERLKERLDEPDQVVGLVDVGGAPREIREQDGMISIGSLVTLAEIAASDVVQRSLGSLAKAAREAASPQIRNRATLGGNLGQHTRCGYYRQRSFPCWKRGDGGCPVREDGGVQEMAGIFANGSCASAHPSSLAPVLGALGAIVRVRGRDDESGRPFHSLWNEVPRAGLAGDLTLAPWEVIAGVDIPPRDARAGQVQAYEEIRQKAAFDWALVSCAVAYDLVDGKVQQPRVWLGAVAPTPWRALGAERELEGKRLDEALAEKAAAAALEGASPLPGNAYKTALVKVAVRRAIFAAAKEA